MKKVKDEIRDLAKDKDKDKEIKRGSGDGQLVVDRQGSGGKEVCCSVSNSCCLMERI
jgi:hypothetical protein